MFGKCYGLADGSQTRGGLKERAYLDVYEPRLTQTSAKLRAGSPLGSTEG